MTASEKNMQANTAEIKRRIPEALAMSHNGHIDIITALQKITDTPTLALYEALGDLFEYETIFSADSVPFHPAFDVVSYPDMLRMNCFIFHRHNIPLLALITDPFNQQTISALRLRAKAPIEFCLAPHNILKSILQRHEDAYNLFEPIDEKKQQRENGDGITLQTISTDLSPAVRTVNSVFYQAYRENASDIHLETTREGIMIRYRMDGILVKINHLDGIETAQHIISRIKVMAELDIAERRIPQDGRLQATIQGNVVNFRVSIMPSIHGEDAVLRILDKQTFAKQVDSLSLDQLGLDDVCIRNLRLLARKPYGMMLMTGPTGSGKTTTLYAILSEIWDGRDKIITIEDPVEYQLNGILQIPVNEKKGLTFSRGLRSILRHDPDKILVGEIRDQSTAEIAVQSALTGHSVFSTVHANNPFDVIGRFTYMGIDLFNFISSLNGVVAQRLVRLICNACKTPTTTQDELLLHYADSLKITQSFIGHGCQECRNSGYHGRLAVAEILLLDDNIREMILRRTPIHQIKEYAEKNGMSTIRSRIAAMVQSGNTSLEEFARNTL